MPFGTRYVSGELHTSPNFLPDGTEAYWSTSEPAIMAMRLANGRWTGPQRLTLSASMSDYRDPFIAPGGQRMYFLSTDVPSGSGLEPKENIWFVDRISGRWLDPVPLPQVVNVVPMHWQVSTSTAGDLYLTSGADGFPTDIYVAHSSKGSFTAPQPLPAPINSEAIEETPFIDPAGRYLIFARSPDTSSGSRLYVSWRDAQGRWGDPILLEPIAYGLCPIVSPDGRYLFFLSSPSSFSWVSMEIVERLAPA